MDLNISITFLKAEVIVFLLSLLYVFYYFSYKIFKIYSYFKNLLKPSRHRDEERLKKIGSVKPQNINHDEYKKEVSELNEREKVELKDLIKRIKINKARGEYDIAKNLIIEAMSIDKFNRDVNIELASLYLMEHEYHKAELIYKDLLLVIDDDFEVLKKLGFVLLNQEKFDLALEIYKKAHQINKQDAEILNSLAYLSYNRGDYLSSVDYFKKYLKDKPRDTENLITLGYAYKNMGNFRDAIITFKRVLDLEPYNEKIVSEISYLESPEIMDTIDNNK